jgi:hypothetical protein
MKLHIVELSSIVKLKPRIEVFNKNNPNKSIFELPSNELALLKSGYSKHGNRVFYNGETYWLHPKHVDNLSKKNKDLNQLGIRVSIDYQNQFEVNTTFLKKIPRKDKITILFEESNELKIKNSIIDKIDSYLRNKGYNIFQFTTIQENTETGLATADRILSALSGFKVKDESFSKVGTTRFDEVHYYDYKGDRIEYLKNLDDILKNRYNSADKEVQKEIYSKISADKHSYIVYLYNIQPNTYNPVVEEKMRLGIERQYEHIKSFTSF